MTGRRCQAIALLAVLACGVALTQASRPLVLAQDMEFEAHEDFAAEQPSASNADASKQLSWAWNPQAKGPKAEMSIEDMLRTIQCSRLRAALRDYQTSARRQYEDAAGSWQPRSAKDVAAGEKPAVVQEAKPIRIPGGGVLTPHAVDSIYNKALMTGKITFPDMDGDDDDIDMAAADVKVQQMVRTAAGSVASSLHSQLQQDFLRRIDAENRRVALLSDSNAVRGALDSLMTLRDHLLRGSELTGLVQHAPGDDWLPEDERLAYVDEDKPAQTAGQQAAAAAKDAELLTYPYGDAAESDSDIVMTSTGGARVRTSTGVPSKPLYVLVSPLSYASAALRELFGRVRSSWTRVGARLGAVAGGGDDSYDYRQYMYDMAYGYGYTDPEDDYVRKEVKKGLGSDVFRRIVHLKSAAADAGSEDEVVTKHTFVHAVEDTPTWGGRWPAWLGQGDKEVPAAPGRTAADSLDADDEDCEWQMGMALLGALLLAVTCMVTAFVRGLRALRRAMHPRSDSGLVVPFLVENEHGGYQQGFMLLDEEALQQAASGKGFSPSPAALMSGASLGAPPHIDSEKQRALREWAARAPEPALSAEATQRPIAQGMAGALNAHKDA